MILERCRIFGKPVLVQSGVNEAWTHNGVPLLSNSISAKDKFNSYSAICILLASLRNKIFTDLIKLKTIAIRYSYNGLWASVLEEERVGYRNTKRDSHVTSVARNIRWHLEGRLMTIQEHQHHKKLWKWNLPSKQGPRARLAADADLQNWLNDFYDFKPQVNGILLQPAQKINC